MVQSPVGSQILSSESWCVQDLLVPSKTGIFPPVLWKSYNQIPLAFKVRFPGDSQSLCWIPRLGSLTWGSEISQQWENFFAISVLQFVGHPPSGLWDLILSCSHPSYHLTATSSLSLDVGYLFWVSSSILLSVGVQQRVAVLAHRR